MTMGWWSLGPQGQGGGKKEVQNSGFRKADFGLIGYLLVESHIIRSWREVGLQKVGISIQIWIYIYICIWIYIYIYIFEDHYFQVQEWCLSANRKSGKNVKRA